MSSSRPGLLISFEGSEGCGKSTQIRLLQARLEKAGLRARTLREPGSTAVGERVRDLLQHEKQVHGMVPEAELLLFAASRAQLVREVLRPALAGGETIILDRFLDSTTVYQGVARGLPLAAVAAVNAFAVGEVMPHLTIVLDMDVELARQRILASGRELDRMEQQPIEFFERVRQGYLQLAAQHPQRIVVLHAGETADALAEKIWNLFTERYYALQS
jgi:dTMP kinase